MSDVELSQYKVLDCPLLPLETWKTTFADCVRCRCALSDVCASIQNDPKPFVVCDVGKGEGTHLGVVTMG